MERNLMDYFSFLISSFRKNMELSLMFWDDSQPKRKREKKGSSPLKFILRKWIFRIKVYNLPFKKSIGQIFIENLLRYQELF